MSRRYEFCKEKPGKKTDVINLADVVATVKISPSDDGATTIGLSMRFGPNKNLKPERIFETVLGMQQKDVRVGLKIRRTALGLETAPGRFRYL